MNNAGEAGDGRSLQPTSGAPDVGHSQEAAEVGNTRLPLGGGSNRHSGGAAPPIPAPQRTEGVAAFNLAAEYPATETGQILRLIDMKIAHPDTSPLGRAWLRDLRDDIVAGRHIPDRWPFGRSGPIA